MLAVLLLALALQSAPPSQTTEVKITTASRRFDFVIHVDVKSDDDDESGAKAVEGAGSVAVYAKGKTVPLQTIAMGNLLLKIGKDGDAPVNTTRLYDEQSTLNVGDFNFDGHEDFAVQNGNKGSYGGPSYSVFLFNPHKGRFVENGPMAKLTEETLGFFQVDKVHRQLVTLAKSGCCYHEMTQYGVVANKLMPAYREIEDATKDEKYVYVTKQHKVAGKWQGSTKRFLQSEYYK